MSNDNNYRPDLQQRRNNSFGNLIKRSKSRDLLEPPQQTPRPVTQVRAPVLPTYSPQAQMETFGGEDYVPNEGRMSRTAVNGSRDATPPVPPIPASLASHDPHQRTESMTHRSRYSYAHSTNTTLNSPRRVRRRKDPTPYNILVIGAKNCGKTSFINFLKRALALPARKLAGGDGDRVVPNRSSSSFTHHYQEIEIDHERIGLTLWDSHGLEKGLVDLQVRELTSFVESKFEETFAEEMKVVRSPGVQDTEIHCIFILLDPSRLDMNLQAAQDVQTASNRVSKPTRVLGALDEDFDLQVLRSFQGKTTVIPIISKSDTVTTQHMAYLKQQVWQSLKQADLDPLEALNVAQESEDEQVEDENEIAEDEVAEERANVDSENESIPTSTVGNDSDPQIAAGNAARERRGGHKREPSKTSISSLMMDSGYVPMSVLSPDSHSLKASEEANNRLPVGRYFPWGFADPYNAEHCDFVKLKDAVFGDWRHEVREACREKFYERWRTNRLNRQAAAKSSAAQNDLVRARTSSGGIPITLKSGRRNMI